MTVDKGIKQINSQFLRFLLPTYFRLSLSLIIIIIVIVVVVVVIIIIIIIINYYYYY